jgi:hypothetical protein
MKMATTDKSRAGLEFPAAVRRAFVFLKGFGFQEVSAEATIVRYATERVFLNVHHGRSSYELGIEVGLLDASSEERGYSLSEFVRLVEPAEAAQLKDFCATTASEVADGVARLATQVKQHVARVLRGDEAIFTELSGQRREWADAFAADVAYRQVSPRAAAAFREKRYSEAADLYESIKSRLSPAELTKLEYAKQHR